MRWFPAVLVSVVASCGNAPPSPADVRARITSDLGNVLRETQAAGAPQLPGPAVFSSLFDGLPNLPLPALDSARSAPSALSAGPTARTLPCGG